MKRFVFGNAIQFNDLWDRLTNGPAKRISFDVVLPAGVTGRLQFETAASRPAAGVRVLLINVSVDAPQFESRMLNMLVLGENVEYHSARELMQAFKDMQVDYDVESSPDVPVRTRGGFFIDPVKLSAAMKEQIVGQDSQIEGIASCVSNHLKKRHPQKPLTIMLSGPTGTGKTATARCLAEILQRAAGREEFPLILVNCNELKEAYRISQLVGSPAGYVGHEERCMMEPMRKTSRAIIVFDEYEKAHPDIHTAVMSWMDSGRVTLSRASKGASMDYDCTGSIIMMTSNFTVATPRLISANSSGAGELSDGRITSDNDRYRNAMVKSGFKPEIAGRISYFFEYNKLSASDIEKIIELTVRRKAYEYGVELDCVVPELLKAMSARYGVGTFGVRALESDLDRLIGERIDGEGNHDGRFVMAGTPDNIVLREKKRI